MKIEVGSGNVFADLGLPNAAELKRIADECRRLPNGTEIFKQRAKALREGVRE